MYIKDGQWEGKTIQVEKGNRKIYFFLSKLKKAIQIMLNCVILHKKKGNEDGKNHITFSVESVSLIIF